MLSIALTDNMPDTGSRSAAGRTPVDPAEIALPAHDQSTHTSLIQARQASPLTVWPLADPRAFSVAEDHIVGAMSYVEHPHFFCTPRESRFLHLCSQLLHKR